MKRRKITRGQGNSNEGRGDTSVTGNVLKQLSGKVQKGSFEHRFERRRYLNQLVQEFQTTTSMECKQQVLANLANFAYDPYNYHFFQEIGVIPIFLAELRVNRDPTLSDFAIAGICNCVADPRIQKEILKSDGIGIILQYLTSTSETTLISTMTTLFILLSTNSEVSQSLLHDDNFRHQVLQLTTNADNRVRNAALLLQEDFFKNE